MGLIELFILAVGLSMDAFAVSICKGLSVKKVGVKECCIVGVWFGGFQALMPLIGYLLGSQFKDYITSIDHWIAFILLLIIGVNMIRESRQKEEDEEVCPKEENPFAFKTMLMLAVATSIDALAVGINPGFPERGPGSFRDIYRSDNFCDIRRRHPHWQYLRYEV